MSPDECDFVEKPHKDQYLSCEIWQGLIKLLSNENIIKFPIQGYFAISLHFIFDGMIITDVLSVKEVNENN